MHDVIGLLAASTLAVLLAASVGTQPSVWVVDPLVKAFREERLTIPGVIRLGGNYEELAVEILDSYLKEIPAKVEGYGRDDSPEFCAQRMEELIKENAYKSHQVQPVVESEPPPGCYSFQTITGEILFDHQKCPECRTKGCVKACKAEILKLEDERPVLAVTPEEAQKGRCTKCLACEIFCTFHEQEAISIHLPIQGLRNTERKS